MGGGEEGGGGNAIHYTPSGPRWVDDTNEIKGMAKGQGGKVEKVTQDERMVLDSWHSYLHQQDA